VEKVTACVIEGLDVLVEGLLDAVKTMLHMLTYIYGLHGDVLAHFELYSYVSGVW
jgi:hypothetical protein